MRGRIYQPPVPNPAAIIFLAIAWEKSVVPNPVARRKTPAAQ
jgi:hypothetical protein